MPEKTKTHILATIGPSSASKEVIEQLIDSGADAFRSATAPTPNTKSALKLSVNYLRKKAVILP